VIRECRRIQFTLKLMGMVDKSLRPDPSVAKNAIAFFQNRKN
jgi:hypothetical protein